ncbi:flagellin lysine-N-methylase [Clostridium grantii]|uniref:Lysine-N-methylase n=1 Tax=Clostridium grantii DSM 8605 TaxID=1121316 RepID=A0A1M5VCC2_9CLOT|nr:flagellin lysine-N-methylase [Clostridium grantii]SHH72922.1 lysine-N-methylase [Clostridium grantii DSM 8605]
MKIRVPDYFKNFRCIASECEDTCCAGWEVVIDDDTYNHYQEVKLDFGKRLRNEIVHKDGENVFVLKGNNCPFLNENKMCDIYSEIGEDSLCYTCKQYPRYMEEFGGLREVGISLSCPEAARLILNDSSKTEFKVSENQEGITSYNDIDAMFYINLMRCRKSIIDILQNREIDLDKRACLVLKFASEIQEKIDEDSIQGIEEVKEKYSDSNFIKEYINSLHNHKSKESIKYKNMHEFFKVFKELKHINPNDPLKLNDVVRCFWESDNEELYLAKHKNFNKYYEDKMYKFENLLVYFVFRYFMKAVFDWDVSAKIKLAVVSYLMIKELFVLRWIEKCEFTDGDAVDIMHMYSKDIEHLEENIETLAEIFEINHVFKVDELLNVLSCNS